LKVELSQIPSVQGAMMTLNAKNGEIVTMVGGYDFYTNKFNNATQAYRQTGSCVQAVHLHCGSRMGHDSGHACERRADQHRRLAATQLRRLDKLAATCR
jgi:hypothetical protein